MSTFCKNSKSLASKYTHSSRLFGSSSLSSHIPRVFGLRDRYVNRESQEAIANDALLSKLARKDPVRVTITGAAGAIGYALMTRLCNGEMLGPDQPIILNCLELPGALNALRG
eukprot:387993_1